VGAISMGWWIKGEGGGRTIEFSCDAGGDLFSGEVLLEGAGADDSSCGYDTLAACAGLGELVVQGLYHVVDDIEIRLMSSRSRQSAHHPRHGSAAIGAIRVRHSLRWRRGLAGSRS
jgi:hypothetical protein